MTIVLQRTMHKNCYTKSKADTLCFITAQLLAVLHNEAVIGCTMQFFDVFDLYRICVRVI